MEYADLGSMTKKSPEFFMDEKGIIEIEGEGCGKKGKNRKKLCDLGSK